MVAKKHGRSGEVGRPTKDTSAMAEIADLAIDPVAKSLARYSAARGITPTILARLVERERGGVAVDRRSLQRSLLADRPRRETLRDIASALDARRLGRALLRELTAHDAEGIRDDVHFAVIVAQRQRFNRPGSLWKALSAALRAADLDLRYAAYISFEIGRCGLDESNRQPLTALSQTLGFDLSFYERTTDDRARAALAAAERLYEALHLSGEDADAIAAILLKYGVTSEVIHRIGSRAPSTLADATKSIEDDL
jgi:hypothetical protein